MFNMNKMVKELRIWLIAESCKNRHASVKQFIKQSITILNDTEMTDLGKYSSILVNAGIYEGAEIYGDNIKKGPFHTWLINDFNLKLDDIMIKLTK